MSYTERRIVESYSDMLEGLSAAGKIELIESLSKSLAAENKNKDKVFYKSFGAFASQKSAEKIAKEIRSSRKFRKREIKF